MRIAIVIHRYGTELNGGSELHCRWIAERLAKHHQVEVLTTCAQDYISWRNEFSEGKQEINGVMVHRFKVEKERNIYDFAWQSKKVFRNPASNSLKSELKWLSSEGPYSPKLIEYIVSNKPHYDIFIFYCYRYYLSYHGIFAVPEKSILIPTAEHDQTIYLNIAKTILNKPKGIIYLSPEEKQLIEKVTSNHSIQNAVLGVGIDIPQTLQPDDFRKKYQLDSEFIIYIGRIDPNKGSDRLFNYFLHYLRSHPDKSLKLVLLGKNVMKIPKDKHIVHLGFVSDQDKLNALAAAKLFIMSSNYESLCMALLEAWSVGKAVLVNGNCEVLKGHCQRSNGGLYYQSYAEFTATLDYLLTHDTDRTQLGIQGKEYIKQNFNWQNVEQAYLDFIRKLVK
ncbi:MAG: glycosyltransferase [bacterium]|nr:glycosyltransferase [bacterium]